MACFFMSYFVVVLYVFVKKSLSVGSVVSGGLVKVVVFEMAC